MTIESMTGAAFDTTLKEIGALSARRPARSVTMIFNVVGPAGAFAGTLIALYGGLVLFVVAAVGIGLFVSSLVATMQQAMLFSFVLLMPFILLSGLATPIGNMPEAFQWITLIDPLRYAIDMTRRIYLEGAGLAQLVGDLWPLLVIGVVTLPIAAWMFRNRLS